MSKYVTKYVSKERVQAYIKAGKCPVCMILLTSEYHTKCQYLVDERAKNPNIIDTQKTQAV